MPREFSKKLPTAEAARAAFDNRVRVKLSGGFVHVSPAEQVSLGFECSSQGCGTGGVLDLSSDGRFVPRHGVRRSPAQVESCSNGPRRSRLHAALYDAAAESLVVQLNSDTCASGLKRFNPRRSTRFNSSQE